MKSSLFEQFMNVNLLRILYKFLNVFIINVLEGEGRTRLE